MRFSNLLNWSIEGLIMVTILICVGVAVFTGPDNSHEYKTKTSKSSSSETTYLMPMQIDSNTIFIPLEQ